MSACAYLVGWMDKPTGLFVDAGIYSEPRPSFLTTADLHRLEPIVLCHVQSRFVDGYERARDAVKAHILRTRELAWVLQTKTYRAMEQS